MKRMILTITCTFALAIGALTAAVSSDSAAVGSAHALKIGFGDFGTATCYDCGGEGSTCRSTKAGWPNCSQGTTKWGMVWCEASGDRSMCSKDAGGFTVWILW